MTLTISKCKLSKQQHTITLKYTLGENEKNSLIFMLMICRNFIAHRNAVCKTRDGLAHLTSLRLHIKRRRVCIKTGSTPVSLSLKGQVTKHTTIKWTICVYCANPKTVNTRIFFGMLLRCEEKANKMQDENTASCNGN